MHFHEKMFDSYIMIEVSFHDLSISDKTTQAQLSFQKSQSRNLFFLKVYFSFTLISSFLHLRHYIILMKNDSIDVDELFSWWEVYLYIFVPLSLVYLRLSLQDLKKKYFCRSFRNLITPNFDFVPTGNISDS